MCSCYVDQKSTDCEVFVFTDNMTAERAFWKGTSSSEKLCDIVLALQELEMETGITIHMVHVSEQRMISQGTDRLSRGNYTQGCMLGTKMEKYIPLHLPAFD